MEVYHVGTTQNIWYIFSLHEYGAKDNSKEKPRLQKRNIYIATDERRVGY